jgi:hypothetical protein
MELISDGMFNDTLIIHILSVSDNDIYNWIYYNISFGIA